MILSTVSSEIFNIEMHHVNKLLMFHNVRTLCLWSNYLLKKLHISLRMKVHTNADSCIATQGTLDFSKTTVCHFTYTHDNETHFRKSQKRYWWVDWLKVLRGKCHYIALLLNLLYFVSSPLLQPHFCAHQVPTHSSRRYFFLTCPNSSSMGASIAMHAKVRF